MSIKKEPILALKGRFIEVGYEGKMMILRGNEGEF